MKIIVVTGAAGFIGSNVARKLNQQGFDDLVLVDKFNDPVKQRNIDGIKCSQKIERGEFIAWLADEGNKVDFIFHLGARTDTTEFDFAVLEELNLNYTKALWNICVRRQIPLVYASSAATYGMGENGFDDAVDLLPRLKPLNPYGLSKHLFDLFVMEQKEFPPLWAGLKFFNVYGPHEEHKGRMASVVFHAYNQIMANGSVKLFKSHKADYKDGEQLRDFIFVDDVVNVCLFFLYNNKSGIYNVGTGKARTFNHLVKAIFSALNKGPQIAYIPIPEDIRDKYQYFTEARMQKLIGAGYNTGFTAVEDGVGAYVNYLKAAP